MRVVHQGAEERRGAAPRGADHHEVRLDAQRGGERAGPDVRSAAQPLQRRRNSFADRAHAPRSLSPVALASARPAPALPQGKAPVPFDDEHLVQQLLAHPVAVLRLHRRGLSTHRRVQDPVHQRRAFDPADSPGAVVHAHPVGRVAHEPGERAGRGRGSRTAAPDDPPRSKPDGRGRASRSTRRRSPGGRREGRRRARRRSGPSGSGLHIAPAEFRSVRGPAGRESCATPRERSRVPRRACACRGRRRRRGSPGRAASPRVGRAG